MPTAGAQTVTTDSTVIYNDVRGCTTFRVRVGSASGFPGHVNIPGLHDDSEWFPIPVGGDELFRLYHDGIKVVYAKGNGGSADIEFGAVAKSAS